MISALSASCMNLTSSPELVQKALGSYRTTLAEMDSPLTIDKAAGQTVLWLHILVGRVRGVYLIVNSNRSSMRKTSGCGISRWNASRTSYRRSWVVVFRTE